MTPLPRPTSCSSSAPMPRSTAPRPSNARRRADAQRRRRVVSGISRKRADQPGRWADPQRRLRHVAGIRPARRGRRGDRLCPCRRVVGTCPAARRGQRRGGRGRPFGRCSRTATRHQLAALLRCQSSRATEFPARTALLAEIDAYARGKDARVVQVMASIAGEWQAVQIMRADGTRVADLRPLVRLNVAVVVEQAGRRETGSYGTGGRFAYDHVTAPWSGAARSTRRSVRHWSIWTACLRRPAKWRSCLVPAGPASCCMRRSATVWKAISIARRPRRLLASW